MRLFGIAAACFATSLLASPYDTKVLQDHPALYLRMGSTTGSEPDLSGHGLVARYHPSTRPPHQVRMPNGDAAADFDGVAQYLEVADSPLLSIPAGGAFTFEAWIRPSTLQFPSSESDGYVHWAGKGEPNQHEYALRMYSLNNSANRPNRISGYVFNPDGGLGSGSYFQDSVSTRQFIHVTLVVDVRTAPGTVAIYKNAELRKTTSLDQFGVTPRPGNAPLRIGTRDLASFFQGAIGKVAIYRFRLSDARLRAHYIEMRKWR